MNKDTHKHINCPSMFLAVKNGTIEEHEFNEWFIARVMEQFDKAYELGVKMTKKEFANKNASWVD